MCIQINPVKQTKPTNCFAACLATALGCSIDTVPVGADGASWCWDSIQNWLAREFGLQLAEVYLSDETRIYPIRHEVVCIVTGKSPRECKTGRHAVVCKTKGLAGFELLHDPHESNAGLDGDATHVCFFVPINVSDVFMSKPKKGETE